MPNNRSSVMYMLALRKAVMRQRRPGDADGGEPSNPGLPSWFPRRTAADNAVDRGCSPAPPGSKANFFSRRSVSVDEPRSSWYVDDTAETSPPSQKLAPGDSRRQERPPIPPRPSGAMRESLKGRAERSIANGRERAVTTAANGEELVYAEPLPCVGRVQTLPPENQRPNSDGYLVPLPFLVQSCISYLETPRALKEEGLFRVPGDVTRIRHLKAAFDTLEQKDINFTSGRSLASFLQEEVSNEPDPNTIAGLLKMYLREQTFIKAETCKCIVSVLYGQQRDRTVSNPMADLDLLQIALQQQVPQIKAEEAPQRAAELKDILKAEVSSKARAVLGAMCKLLFEVGCLLLFLSVLLSVCMAAVPFRFGPSVCVGYM